jgi:hypothetical protein
MSKKRISFLLCSFILSTVVQAQTIIRKIGLTCANQDTCAWLEQRAFGDSEYKLTGGWVHSSGRHAEQFDVEDNGQITGIKTYEKIKTFRAAMLKKPEVHDYIAGKDIEKAAEDLSALIRKKDPLESSKYRILIEPPKFGEVGLWRLEVSFPPVPGESGGDFTFTTSVRFDPKTQTLDDKELKDLTKQFEIQKQIQKEETNSSHETKAKEAVGKSIDSVVEEHNKRQHH